jgi:biopolymer transport protein ExbD
MAEISTSDNNSKKTRSHKSSTKIDMTPMVDLGFLLITFFMLTTTLAKPVIMQLNMPEKDGKLSSAVRCSESLTVVLDDQNKVFYYQGAECDPKPKETDFSDRGIRQVLFDYKRKIGENFTVVIKSTNKAKYRNMIDLLDEMKITNNRRYAIVNITSEDEKLLSVK